MAIQLFKCPELGTYHGGVAEAIVSFDQADQPKGIICSMYRNDCNCQDKVSRRDRSYNYELQQAGLTETCYAERHENIVEKISRERGLKASKLSDSQKKDLSILADKELQVQKDAIFAKVDFDTRCIVAKGLKSLTAQKPGENQ